MPDTQRQNIGKANKGKKRTDIARERYRQAKLGSKNPMFEKFDEKHHNFKENPSYRSVHQWIERKLGQPSHCEHCKNNDLTHRQYHWANVSKNYQRISTDWIRLCVKCHKAYDSTEKQSDQH